LNTGGPLPRSKNVFHRHLIDNIDDALLSPMMKDLIERMLEKVSL
jgi:hypothetical protein